MKRFTTVVLAALITGMSVLSACQPKPTPATRPALTRPVDLKQVVAGDISKTQARLNELRKRSEVMPGHDEAQYRALIGSAFGCLLDLLPAVHGTGPDGRVAINQTTISGSQNALRTLPPDADSAPTVATALRAATDSLNDIAAQQFADQADINATLKSLTTKLGEFDTTTGPMAKQVAKEAVILITDALQQMVDVQAARAGVAK